MNQIPQGLKPPPVLPCRETAKWWRLGFQSGYVVGDARILFLSWTRFTEFQNYHDWA